MVERLEPLGGEVAPGADLAQHHVVLLAARRRPLLDHVVDPPRDGVELVGGGVHLALQGLDAVRQLARPGQQVLALLALGGRDLLAERLLLGPGALELLRGGAAALVGGEHGVDQGLVGASGALAGADDVGILTQTTQVDHASRLVDTVRRPAGGPHGAPGRALRPRGPVIGYRAFMPSGAEAAEIAAVAVAAGAVGTTARWWWGRARGRRRPPGGGRRRSGAGCRAAVGGGGGEPDEGHPGRRRDRLARGAQRRAGVGQARVARDDRPTTSASGRRGWRCGPAPTPSSRTEGTGRCGPWGPSLAGTDVPLGLLPAGTGNLLARNLPVPHADLDAALAVALTGPTRRIDVGRAEIDVSGEDEAPRGETFLVMAGLGFDAEVMASVEHGLKERMGWWAYVVAGVRNLRGRQTRVTLRLDERGAGAAPPAQRHRGQLRRADRRGPADAGGPDRRRLAGRRRRGAARCRRVGRRDRRRADPQPVRPPGGRALPVPAASRWPPRSRCTCSSTATRPAWPACSVPGWTRRPCWYAPDGTCHKSLSL